MVATARLRGVDSVIPFDFAASLWIAQLMNSLFKPLITMTSLLPS